MHMCCIYVAWQKCRQAKFNETQLQKNGQQKHLETRSNSRMHCIACAKVALHATCALNFAQAPCTACIAFNHMHVSDVTDQYRIEMARQIKLVFNTKATLSVSYIVL